MTPTEQTEDHSHGVNISEVLRQLQGLAAFVQEGPFEDRELPEYVGRYRVIDRLGQGGRAAGPAQLRFHRSTICRHQVVSWRQLPASRTLCR